MGYPDSLAFSQRLYSLIGQESAAKFARNCGIGDSTIRKYLDGAEPGLEKVMQIWMATGCSLSWLVAGEGDMYGPAVAVHQERASYGPVEDSDFLIIPRSGVKASAGLGRETFYAEQKYGLKFRRDWLIKKGLLRAAEDGALIIYDVIGDSMEPSLHDGDMVLFRKDECGYVGDDVYLVLIDSEYRIKRLSRRPGGAFEVISDNREKYEPFVVNESNEALGFEVVGRFVWRGGDRL